MPGKSKNIKSNLSKINRTPNKKSYYDELPEITDEMLARAEYKVNGVTKPIPKKRGPQKKPTKLAVNIRLPREVINYFKIEGKGWQAKIGDVLAQWIETHPHE